MKPIGVMHPTEIPPFSDTIEVAVLAAGTGQAFDIPAGANFVTFGADCNYLVRWGSTGAAVPTTSSTAATNSEVNPLYKNIGSTLGCTGISLISPTSGIVSMAWAGR